MNVDDVIGGRRLAAFGVVGSNLVPLLGVVALGWSTTALLGIYLIETWAVLLWTVAKTPFAEKRPHNGFEDGSHLLASLQEKRGGFRLHRRLPPVYPRNLPVLVGLAVLLGPMEVVAGLFAFSLSDPQVAVPAVTSMAAGGVAVFCGRGVEFWTDYLRDAGYRDHSPRSLALTPLKHFFGVGALLLGLGTLTAEAGRLAVDSRTVLVVVVAAKTAYDLHGSRIARGDGERSLFARLYGSRRTEIDPIPVETPDGTPRTRATPHSRAVTVDALGRGVVYALTVGGVFVYPVALLGWLVDPVLGVVAASAVAATFAAARAFERYVRYATLEYRRYDGAVVAYDTWLDEPQRRLATDAITDVAVSRGPVGRAFDTATVELDAPVDDGPSFGLFAPEEPPTDDANDDRPMTLVQVAEPDRIVDVPRDAE